MGKMIIPYTSAAVQLSWKKRLVRKGYDRILFPSLFKPLYYWSEIFLRYSHTIRIQPFGFETLTIQEFLTYWLAKASFFRKFLFMIFNDFVLYIYRLWFDSRGGGGGIIMRTILRLCWKASKSKFEILKKNNWSQIISFLTDYLNFL